MLLQLLSVALIGAPRDASADTVPAAATRVPPAAVVHIASDDGLGELGVFTALGAELRLEAPGPARAGKSGSPAELRVSRRPDSLTALLAARLASGRRLAAVTVELPGPSDTLRVRLVDVTVTAARLVIPPASDVEGQRVAQEMAVSQAAADRAEAARQLAEAEALAALEPRERTRLVPANALARARDQVRLLDLRLAAARRQLGLVDERAAREAAPTEDITLHAERAEIVSGTWR